MQEILFTIQQINKILEKKKIEKSVITIRVEKGKDVICIDYLLDGCSYRFNQNEIFKDFEDFKNSFCLKF